jgi:epsilon-lactone hydrolase
MPSESINQLIALGTELLHPEITIPDMRAAIDQVSAIRPPVNGIVTEDTAAPVAGRWIADQAASGDATILWFHGGGYVAGEPPMMDGMGAALSAQTGARMFVPRYRVGPEDPFPAALDDAIAAYRWILDAVAAPATIVVGGDSAGGGLALALLLRLRDEGVDQPAGGVTFSPWTDLAITGESLVTRAEFTFGMSEPLMKRLAAAYLRDHDPMDPHASPVYGDFTGLCPLHIQVGDHEVLLDDSRRVAKAADAAGVAVDIRIWPEMPHVHQAFVGVAPESDEAVTAAARWITTALADAHGGRPRS